MWPARTVALAATGSKPTPSSRTQTVSARPSPASATETLPAWACRVTFASSSLVQRRIARSFGPGSPSASASVSANPARSAAMRALWPIAAASPACSSRYGCRSATAPRSSATVA